MEIYKDMLEKLKYHKQLLMNAFIRKNYYPSNEEVNAALADINARLSLFESYISKPGSYFNPTEINYCFEMLYKDIEILYKVLQDILANEYSQLKLCIESTMLELEAKADYFQKRCSEEANSTTLGTTIMFQANSWNISTKDQTTIIDLGEHKFIEGSTIACFANINNINKDSVSFKFVADNDNKSFLALPHNLYDNINYKIPGKLGINEKIFSVNKSAIVDGHINLDYETNPINKYKICGGNNLISVTYKSSGVTELVEFPDMSNYNFLALQDCFIEFYVVDGNISDNSYLEYNFNMKPASCNFSLQNGTIKLSKDIKRIFIDAQKGLTVSFSCEHGTIYAECMDAIIADKNTVIYAGNNKIRDMVVREYVRTRTIDYKVYAYINTVETIIDDIQSIYIKEIE